ncbi:MAG: chemotaxis protein CheW [Planctomycetes bacterium]|nr:chemotaxis protein CheW [Planctomycetota bacterium]
MEHQTTSGMQFCTFRLGDLFLGVDVQCVQEVIRYQEMTSVPLAPVAIRGLINLRGQIVTAIDLRKQLDLPPSQLDTPPMNVVIRMEDGAASLLVDEIGDVLDIGEDAFETPPETIRGAARRLISGVFKLDDGLLLVLDPRKAIQVQGTAAETVEAAS